MKDLNYYKENAIEGMLKTPISVLRYIGRLELELDRTEVRVLDGIIARTITDQRVIDELGKLRENTDGNDCVYNLDKRIEELKKK
jgi:hypothetical protein